MIRQCSLESCLQAVGLGVENVNALGSSGGPPKGGTPNGGTFGVLPLGGPGWVLEMRMRWVILGTG